MSFLASSTIPQLNYATYSSLPTPPVGTVHYDRVYNDEHAAIKVALRNLLKQNKLSYTPLGFPFKFNTVSHEYAKFGRAPTDISYASYEFREEFYTSDRRLGGQYATISFISPNSRGSRMMTWTVSVPARQSYGWNNSSGTVVVAHVQVDPIIMETSFGIDLMTNPRIIQEAMALSIELGILITIQVANRSTPMKYPAKRNIIYDPGEIIFLATDNSGRSEVVFVFV